MSRKNIFICGLSGSGKDVIAKHLRDTFNYRIIRLSATVKNYVFETYAFKTVEEYEKLKRSLNAIRIAHNNFGDYYDNQGSHTSGKLSSEIRLKHIIDNELLENDTITGYDKMSMCVPDIRNYKDAQKLLEAGWLGIFLTRTSKEFKKESHWTEQSVFSNNDFLLENNFNNSKNMIVIDNASRLDLPSNIRIDYITDGSVEQLRECVNKIILQNETLLDN